MYEYPGRHFSLNRQRLPDGRAVIGVRGSVDLFAAPELKRRLFEAVDGGAEEVIVDLSETEFLDSTGLGALLGADKRLSRRGGRLVIVPGAASVMRVFEITGLDAILSFASSRDQALAAAGAPA